MGQAKLLCSAERDLCRTANIDGLPMDVGFVDCTKAMFLPSMCSNSQD